MRKLNNPGPFSRYNSWVDENVPKNFIRAMLYNMYYIYNLLQYMYGTALYGEKINIWETFSVLLMRLKRVDILVRVFTFLNNMVNGHPTLYR